MTAVIAFQTVSALIMIALVVGFLIFKFRYVIWRGYFRAIIVCEDKDVVIRTMRLKTSDTEFIAVIKGRADRYDILDERVYRIGKFRIPTSMYIAHRAEAIDMLQLKLESKISATRNQELARNTVTSGLLNAFKEDNLKQVMTYMLAVIIVLGGMLILGYYLNSRLETIIERLGG